MPLDAAYDVDPLQVQDRLYKSVFINQDILGAQPP
jgi:hypothetical protein